MLRSNQSYYYYPIPRCAQKVYKVKVRNANNTNLEKSLNQEAITEQVSEMSAFAGEKKAISLEFNGASKSRSLGYFQLRDEFQLDERNRLLF